MKKMETEEILNVVETCDLLYGIYTRGLENKPSTESVETSEIATALDNEESPNVNTTDNIDLNEKIKGLEHQVQLLKTQVTQLLVNSCVMYNTLVSIVKQQETKFRHC